MKRNFFILLIGVALGGGAVWLKYHGSPAAAAADKPAEAPEEPKTTITHAANGDVTIKMTDDAQGDAGILVSQPNGAQFNAELKAYGHVMDPTPLAALANELATARAALVVSSNELARQQTLATQGNASTRALQAAEAAAQHDKLAMESARDRLVLSWSSAVADRNDLPKLLQSLATQDAALARVDLPAGENLTGPPASARLAPLSGQFADADFVGAAAGVDPQTQGRGLLFLLQPNTLKLQPGQAVTAQIKLPGEPQAGVIVPRDAVVRTEGAGWVYTMDKGSEAFNRVKISLEHPVENGWFVTTLNTNEYLVTTGAQSLLSEELKGATKPD